MIRLARENKLWQTSSSLVNRKVELSRIKVGFQYFNLAQFLEGKNQSKVLTLTQEGKQTVFLKIMASKYCWQKDIIMIASRAAIGCRNLYCKIIFAVEL